MSRHLDVPPGSRPLTTTTDTDTDVFGTPTANTPLVTPQPLGRDGMPGPVPSAFSLSPTATPRDSTYNNYVERDYVGTPNNNSAPLLPPGDNADNAYNKEGGMHPGSAARRRPFYKRPWFCLLLLAAAVVIALAVALPVTLVGKKSSSSGGASGGSSGGGGSGGGGGKGGNLATSGGNGSTVTADDGSTFVYNNPFGGFCESPCLF
jgi:glucan 1,3-beta-glucosidase